MHQSTSMTRKMCWAFVLAVIALYGTLLFTPCATGDDIVWNGTQNSDWHTATNWDGGAVPIDGDTATLNTPPNDNVTLSADVFGIDGLTVSNSVDLFTNGFFLNVDELGTAQTQLTETGTTLVVTPRTSDPSLPAFRTEELEVFNGAQISMQGGLAQAEIDAVTSANSTIVGYGTFEFGNDFSPSGRVLTNDATIFVGKPLIGSQSLTLRALGPGTLDLDGSVGILNPEDGVLDVDDTGVILAGSLSLIVDGPLSDNFGGEILIGQSDTVDFRDPWTISGTFSNPALISLNGGSGTATLTGETMTVDLSADVHVVSGTASIEAPTRWVNGSFTIDSNTLAHINEDTTFDGGIVSVAADGVLLLGGGSNNVNAEIRGGAWIGLGTIDFGGASPFTSSTTVSLPTTMSVATVDLDGGSAATHFLTLNSGLTLNVDSIDDGDGNGSPLNQFDDVMTINSAGRLTVNFNNADDSWVMNGLLMLSGTGNDSHGRCRCRTRRYHHGRRLYAYFLPGQHHRHRWRRHGWHSGTRRGRSHQRQPYRRRHRQRTGRPVRHRHPSAGRSRHDWRKRRFFWLQYRSHRRRRYAQRQWQPAGRGRPGSRRRWRAEHRQSMEHERRRAGCHAGWFAYGSSDYQR